MPLGRIQNPSLPLFPEHLNPFHLENLTSVRIIRALHILCFHITCQEGCLWSPGCGLRLSALWVAPSPVPPPATCHSLLHGTVEP